MKCRDMEGNLVKDADNIYYRAKYHCKKCHGRGFVGINSEGGYQRCTCLKEIAVPNDNAIAQEANNEF